MLGDAEGVELLDAPKMEAIGAAEPTQNWMENPRFLGISTGKSSVDISWTI